MRRLLKVESFVSVFVHQKIAVGYYFRRRIDYQIIFNESFGEEGIVNEGMVGRVIVT